MYIKRFVTLYKWLFADYRNSFSSRGYERLLQPVPYFFAYHNAVHGVFRTLVSHRISLLVPSVVGLARHAQFLRPTIYNRPSTGGDPSATNTFLVLSIWLLAVITPRIVPEILNFLPISLIGDFSLNVHRLLKRKWKFFAINYIYYLINIQLWYSMHHSQPWFTNGQTDKRCSLEKELSQRVLAFQKLFPSESHCGQYKG